MKKTLFTILILLSSVLFCLTGCKNATAKDRNNNSSANYPDISLTGSLDSKNATEDNSSQPKVSIMGTVESWYEYGKSAKDLIDSGAKNQIIAKINGREVTLFQLESAMSTYKDRSYNKRQEAFKNLLKTQASYQRAESLFKIDDSEVLKKAEESYNLLNSSDETKKYFEAYCRGLGIDESEYIDYAKPYMRENLLASKLFEYVSNEHANSKHNLDMTREEYYNEYVDNLYNSADIEILDDTLE